MSGNLYWREQVSEGPTSNGVGTEIPEQLLGETTQHKETDWAIDNGGVGGCKESLDQELDQEGPEEYVAKSTSTGLQSSQGQQKHPEVQWKDSRLQPYIH